MESGPDIAVPPHPTDPLIRASQSITAGQTMHPSLVQRNGGKQWGRGAQQPCLPHLPSTPCTLVADLSRIQRRGRSLEWLVGLLAPFPQSPGLSLSSHAHWIPPPVAFPIAHDDATLSIAAITSHLAEHGLLIGCVFNELACTPKVVRTSDAEVARGKGCTRVSNLLSPGRCHSAGPRTALECQRPTSDELRHARCHFLFFFQHRPCLSVELFCITEKSCRGVGPKQGKPDEQHTP